MAGPLEGQRRPLRRLVLAPDLAPGVAQLDAGDDHAAAARLDALLVLPAVAVEVRDRLRRPVAAALRAEDRPPRARQRHVVVDVRARRRVRVVARQQGRRHAALRVVAEAGDRSVRVLDRRRLPDGAVVDVARLAEAVAQQHAEEPVRVVLVALLVADGVALGDLQPALVVGAAVLVGEQRRRAVGVGALVVAQLAGGHALVVRLEVARGEDQDLLAHAQAALDRAEREAGEAGSVVVAPALAQDRAGLVALDDARDAVGDVALGRARVRHLDVDPAPRLRHAVARPVREQALAHDVAGGVVVVAALLDPHVVAAFAVLGAMRGDADERALARSARRSREQAQLVGALLDVERPVRVRAPVEPEHLGSRELAVQRDVLGAVAGHALLAHQEVERRERVGPALVAGLEALGAAEPVELARAGVEVAVVVAEVDDGPLARDAVDLARPGHDEQREREVRAPGATRLRVAQVVLDRGPVAQLGAQAAAVVDGREQVRRVAGRELDLHVGGSARSAGCTTAVRRPARRSC